MQIGPFATPDGWAKWLSTNHLHEAEIWLVYHKKGWNPSITWAEAVVEALVWGWIDGIRKTIDDTQWQQRFTPRKMGSAWSHINRAHAEKLIETGQMQPAGLAQVEAARANGRWEAAYSGGKNADIPPDFLESVAGAGPVAQQTFATLDSKNRYAIYYRLTMAKHPETRAKRSAEFLEVLRQGKPIV